MIVAYAGRRAQSLLGRPEQVAERLRRLLTALKPAAVVGAAADGADLLVLEAAPACPAAPAVRLVLPSSRAVFAHDSFEPSWRDRSEAVLKEVSGRGGTIRALGEERGAAAYRRANQEILDAATGLA